MSAFVGLVIIVFVFAIIELISNKADARKHRRAARNRERADLEARRPFAVVNSTADFKRELTRAMAETNTARSVELVSALPTWPINRQIVSVIQAVDALKRGRAPAIDSGVPEQLVSNLMTVATEIEDAVCRIATSIVAIMQQSNIRNFAELPADTKSAFLRYSEKMKSIIVEVGNARIFLTNAIAGTPGGGAPDFDRIIAYLKGYISDLS